MEDRRRNDIKIPAFPLSGGRMMMDDGHIVTGIAPESEIAVVDEQTGRGFAPPVEQGWVPTFKRKKKRPVMVRRSFDVEYNLWISCDDRAFAYIFEEDSDTLTLLGVNLGWDKLTKIDAKELRDEETLYFYACNVYKGPNGLIVNLEKRINDVPKKTFVTNLVEWEAALTNTYLLDLDSEQDIINLFKNANWGTPVGYNQHDPTVSIHWPIRDLFTEDGYWLWGGDPMTPQGTETYRLSVFRVKRGLQEE